MPSHAHIPGCARLNVARLNAFRLNYYESILGGYVGDNVNRSKNLRIEGASIQHVLNDAPDTAAFSAHGFTPVAGERIQIFNGDVDAGHQIFGGRILETNVRYESKPGNVAWDLQCIDPTWLLNRRRVLQQYRGSTANDIIGHLLAVIPHSLGGAVIEPGLPVIEALTFTNETFATCLTAICERIGGYWFVDYQNILHVGRGQSVSANPITAAAPHESSDHQLSEDLSQVVTRVIARGAGVGAAIDVAASATELPLDLGDQQNFYSVGGGIAEAGAQRITYSGVRGFGAVGAFLGTGNAPTGAPVPTPAGGNSHTVGATYGYAATFTTASGETVPGPVGAITIATIPMATPSAPTARSSGAGAYPPGMITPGATTMRFAVQIIYNGGAWGPTGHQSALYTWDGNDWEVYLGPTAPFQDGYYYPTLEPGGPVATVNHVQILRSDDGGNFQYISSSTWSIGGGWYDRCASGYTIPPVPPPYASTGFGSVIVKGVPISAASGVTGRKLYRTTANGAALKLLTTIANNTATEYGDTVADGALGAAPPATDASGIKDEGQVLAGATVVPVSSTAPFAPESPGEVGGWARIGNLVIRYSGIGTGTLTGLPATGPGALTATVRHGAQILVQPRLVGVTGLAWAVRKGEDVTLRIEVDDFAAQDALAARLGSGLRADGVVEEVYSDSRMLLAELQDYAEALLLDRKDPRQTLRFFTRDPSCQAGRLITVTLATPPISGTFRIQRVTFSEIAITGGLGRVLPKRQIEASNKLFTFADLLRRLRGRESGAA